jgi:hypothetical protein
MLFMETIRVSSANAVLDAQMESANAAVRRQKKEKLPADLKETRLTHKI